MPIQTIGSRLARGRRSQVLATTVCARDSMRVPDPLDLHLDVPAYRAVVVRTLRASGIRSAWRSGSAATRGSSAPARRRRRRGRPWRGTSSARPRRPNHTISARAARDRGEDVVDQQRDEDAGDDGELLQRAQPAAQSGRGDLGDVGRCDHRGDADAEAADDAEDASAPRRSAENPAPIALMKKSTAAICMTRSRPMRSAMRPANSAPAAAPSSAEATAKPEGRGLDVEDLTDGASRRR